MHRLIKHPKEVHFKDVGCVGHYEKIIRVFLNIPYIDVLNDVPIFLNPNHGTLQCYDTRIKYFNAILDNTNYTSNYF